MCYTCRESIDYIALQLLLWFTALYTLGKLVFQVVLSLLLAFETLEILAFEKASSTMLVTGTGAVVLNKMVLVNHI